MEQGTQPPGAGARPGRSAFASVFTRNFSLIWTSQAISVVGDGFYQVAMMWWVLSHTGSSLKMATVAVCSVVPMALLSPLAGHVVDRVDRKKLMVVADILRMLLTLLPGLLLLFGKLQVWHTYAVSGCLAACRVFFEPALLASVPAITGGERLVQSNSVLILTQSGGSMLGMALGGVLVATVGAGAAMIGDAASFGVSAACLACISISLVATRQSETEKRTAGDLLREIPLFKKRRNTIFVAVLAFLALLLVTPIGILLPIVAKRILKAGPTGYGFLGAAAAAGMLTSSLLLGIKGDVRRKGYLMVLATTTAGLGLAGVGISRFLEVSMVLMFIVGLGASVINVMMTSVFQQWVPDDMRGKAFAAFYVFTQGIRPVALAGAGWLADAFPAGSVIFACGAALACIGAAGSRLPGIKEL